MAFDQGEIVLVPFPFRDRLAEKKRPALVLSSSAFNQLDDLILAEVTSHPPRNSFAYALLDWASANLKSPSTIRILLATVFVERVLFAIGKISDRDLAVVKSPLFRAFS